jgi:hypothetical protein
VTYSASANPPSPYPALARSSPPPTPTPAQQVDKFHVLLLKAARKVGADEDIIGSYRRFQDGDGPILWYFTRVGQLVGAVKRPVLPPASASASEWTAAWRKAGSFAGQVVADLAGKDANRLNLAATATREALAAGVANWPSDLYATGQGSTSAITGWTCSAFVGEALCQAVRGLGLSNTVFLDKNDKGKFVFIGAKNMRGSALFASVSAKEMAADPDSNPRQGYLVSMSEGHHVEILTQLASGAPSESFCSIGAGRPDTAELGKVKCGDAPRMFDSDQNVFLRVSASNATIKAVLNKISR